jgi:hypothetical protein
MGPFLAERCLGAWREVSTVDGISKVVGTRDVAESLIGGYVGAIVPYSDVARAIRVADWMHMH